MKIDGKTISYLEDLCFITLSNAERERIAGDLAAVLSAMETLSRFNAKTAPETGGGSGKESALRADCVKEPFPRAAMLKNAPATDGEYFISPAAIE